MKRILCLLTLIPLTCSALPFTTIPDKTDIPILSPQYAKREISKIELPNGLQALLISDPKLEESGAALVVQAGSWDDPVDHPGLAHFLEHMLFLGTKKYPVEAEYRSHLQSNGGLYNAFTANNFTVYLFTVNTTAFPEALDRFSNFFIEPLFNPSGVAREINAIDQEYAKNLDNDDVRTYFVYKALANPDHPEHRFNIGSTGTLSGTKQEVLKKWFKENYSANNMHLVIYSSLPLDKLKEFAVSDFSSIPNIDRKPINYGSALNKELSKEIVYVEPVKDIRTLSFIWELPIEFTKPNASKPEKLVCHVLGHEGANSLLAVLKEKNLAEGIRCGSTSYCNNPRIMEIEIDLTDKGVENVYEVIGQVHSAIALLAKQGIPESLFQEIKQLKTIDYQFPEREDLFSTLSKDAIRLSTESIDSYPQYGQIPTEYSPKMFQEVLAQLTPDKTVYLLAAPEALTHIKSTFIEPWLQVHYSVQPIPKNILDSWSKAGSSTMMLPESNPFIPTDLTLLSKMEESTTLVPDVQTLTRDEFGILYWAPDNRYGIPKISWSIELKSPLINIGNPKNAALADLTVKAVKDALSGISYPADVAGLKYEIEAKDFGIRITINGYSQHAQLLLDDIVAKLAKVQPSQEQFNIYKQTLLNEYQNEGKDMPIMQAMETFKDLIFKYASTPSEKTFALESVSFDSFNEYTTKLFNQMFIEAVLYGNLTKDQALKTYQSVQAALGDSPYPPSEQPKQETLDLPSKEGPYYLVTQTKSQGNATLLAVEALAYSLEERAAQQILSQGLAEEFFNELRTKQQTGYIVQSWSDNLEKHLFTLFAVQSKSHDPKELLARFEQFLEFYLQELSIEFPEAKFKTVKQALITQLSTPQRSMRDLGTLLQQLAFKFDGNFNYLNERVAALEALSYDRFLELAKVNLSRQNKKRLAILLFGQTPDQLPQYLELEDPASYRKAGFLQAD